MTEKEFKKKKNRIIASIQRIYYEDDKYGSFLDALEIIVSNKHLMDQFRWEALFLQGQLDYANRESGAKDNENDKTECACNDKKCKY